MPKTLGEWERSLEVLSDEELGNISNGIKALEKINEFKEDYGWTGITVFDIFADDILAERKRKTETMKEHIKEKIKVQDLRDVKK